MKILLRILIALAALSSMGGNALMAIKAMKDAKELKDLGSTGSELGGLLGNTFASTTELNAMMGMCSIALIVALALLVLEFTKKAKGILYVSAALLVLSLVAYFMCPDKIASTNGETYRSMAGMLVLGPGIVAGALGIILSRKVNS